MAVSDCNNSSVPELRAAAFAAGYAAATRERHRRHAWDRLTNLADRPTGCGRIGWVVLNGASVRSHLAARHAARLASSLTV
jgi:hypothetical protein